ncbi:MAG: hypothetical protein LBL65_08055 [Campylobacteraceae bacterium]|jgi:hypothetical protein|nr:hypothetical protein [Campylobacteraceae bacterium]
MKQTIIFSTILLLFLTSCGDKKSNSDSSASNNNTNATNQTAPIYLCEGGDVVNGYTLPPCPDPAVNDSTLLGIDSNDNGVRDDVERWIIFRYKDHHRIVTEIGFQAGRAHQFMLANPDKYLEAEQKMSDTLACETYFQFDAINYGEPIVVDSDILTSTAFKTMQLNTKERIETYLTYDKKLSGGVYTLPKGSYKRFCDFDVDELLGK